MATDYSYKKYVQHTSKKRPRPRKRSGRFLLLLIAVVLVVLLVRSRVFVVREIVVVGNLQRSASQITGASGLSLGMSIFSVDEARVTGNLSSDPYVEVLDVHTQIPDTVVIEVMERIPRAAVNCAGVILLIDEEGYILERMNHLPSDQDVIIISGMDVLVSIQGDVVESRMFGQMNVVKRVLTAVYEAGMDDLVSELNAADLDNLYLVSESGIQVILGNDEQLRDKLVWMEAVLKELTEEGIMRGVLDVSSGKNAVYSER